VKKRKAASKARRPLSKKTLRRVRTAQASAASKFTVGGKRNKKIKPVSVARKVTRKPKPTASVAEGDAKLAEAAHKLEEYHEPHIDDPGDHVRVILPNKDDESVRDVQPVLQGDDDPELPGEAKPT